MKKILFSLVLAVFFACNKKTITKEPLCQNPPPSFGIVVVKNEVSRNRYFDGIENAKKEAVLYKLTGSEKNKIQNLGVDNENIYMLNKKKEVKTFFTGNLETFYVEYKGKVDTLQIKGIYHDSTGCGDRASLSELYFNGKEIDIKNNLIDDGVYKIENTTPKE